MIRRLALLMLSGCFAQLGHSEAEFVCQQQCKVDVVLSAVGGALTSSQAVTIVRSETTDRCAIGEETTSEKSCSLLVDPGDAVQLVASETFREWSGACRGSEPECNLSILAETQVTARFCTLGCR